MHGLRCTTADKRRVLEIAPGNEEWRAGRIGASRSVRRQPIYSSAAFAIDCDRIAVASHVSGVTARRARSGGDDLYDAIKESRA